MSQLDFLIEEKLIPMRKRILETIQTKHATFYTIINTLLTGKEQIVGLVITEQGQELATYNIYTDGLQISKVEKGILQPKVSLPVLGEIRPVAVMEQRDLENLIADEEDFQQDLSKTLQKHLPAMHIHFMQSNTTWNAQHHASWENNKEVSPNPNKMAHQ